MPPASIRQLLDTTSQQVTGALGLLRSSQQVLGTNATVLQIRLEFTKNYVTKLQDGSDKLTLADLNQEGAFLATLQTRLQFEEVSLSITTKGEDRLLRLFYGEARAPTHSSARASLAVLPRRARHSMPGTPHFEGRPGHEAKDTRLTQLGRRSAEHHGIVNPPIYRASTILYGTMAGREAVLQNPYDNVTYGLNGTPTTFAVEEAVAALEHGDRAVAVGSGLAAIAVALIAFLKQGDHVLIPDPAYGPTRTFADRRPRAHGHRPRAITTRRWDPASPTSCAPRRARDLSRSTRLAHLRDAGCAGDRRRGQERAAASR